MKEERLENERQLPHKFWVEGPEVHFASNDLLATAWELNQWVKPKLSPSERAQLRGSLRALVKDGKGELRVKKFTVIYPAPGQ